MNKKRIILLLILSTTFLIGCNKNQDIDLNSNVEPNTIIKTKESINKIEENNNVIKKVEGTTVYLNDNSPINLSGYNNLDNSNMKDISSNSKARLYTFKYDDKNMYFIYTGPKKKEVDLIEGLKGIEITGVIKSVTESSLQIEDDSVYNVSLNCYVYTNENEYKPYSEVAAKIKSNSVGKILIANNEVVSIKIF